MTRKLAAALATAALLAIGIAGPAYAAHSLKGAHSLRVDPGAHSLAHSL